MSDQQVPAIIVQLSDNNYEYWCSKQGHLGYSRGNHSLTAHSLTLTSITRVVNTYIPRSCIMVWILISTVWSCFMYYSCTFIFHVLLWFNFMLCILISMYQSVKMFHLLLIYIYCYLFFKLDWIMLCILISRLIGLSKPKPIHKFLNPSS